MLIKLTVIALLGLFLGAAGTDAVAYSCTTTCSGGGVYRSCTTNCF